MLTLTYSFEQAVDPALPEIEQRETWIFQEFFCSDDRERIDISESIYRQHPAIMQLVADTRLKL